MILVNKLIGLTRCFLKKRSNLRSHWDSIKNKPLIQLTKNIKKGVDINKKEHIIKNVNELIGFTKK